MDVINPIVKESFVEDMYIKGMWGMVEYMFHVYRNVNFRRGRNLVSVCFFLLKEVDEVYSFQREKKNYKKEGYDEHLQKYFNGIKNISKMTKKSNLDITLRIYCDITTAKFLKNYLYNTHVELYIYYFPQFFDKKLMVHYGFFGTLIRYLPLFKLPKHNDGNWESVTVCDIDIRFSNELRLMKFFINEVKDVNFFFKNASCYYLMPRLLELDLRPPYITIISSFFVQKEPQDFLVYEDFLNNCILNPCKKYEESLRKYLPFNLEKRPLGGRLEYGVDEFFMNYFFLRRCYLEKNKNLLEVFVGKKEIPIKSILKYLIIQKPKIEEEEMLRQFLRVCVALFFRNDFVESKNASIWVMIEVMLLELENPIYRREYKKEELNKLIDILKKIEPKKIGLPDNVFVCFERVISTEISANIIKIVKPNPVYPAFSEEDYKIIRFT